ncbi:hypothetical protein BO71DRAFT_435973 [Aspergillus ellipticus CBS 707.79]|uniref:NAD(P)-binding protein n=1 Tax=Aspergillus ellipticus CBS 707.79 TaxID=1448320 RepID=A0A319CSD3_9EURO|nr:hypothetical protein BO71DRAFT_435973 [Aspergillus ellipticus CBS 707.79]
MPPPPTPTSQQPPKLIHTTPSPLSPSTPNTPPSNPPITIDLLLTVLTRTLFHPFLAWLTVLCLRAQATPYTAPAFRITTAYATLLTLFFILRTVNQRIGYGAPRTVDLGDEVVVVTGGASGLGLLIARIYGLRGEAC